MMHLLLVHFLFALPMAIGRGKSDEICSKCSYRDGFKTFFIKSPSVRLGEKGEVQAAIPDALFKIVIRENQGDNETLSFIVPNIKVDKKVKFFE